MRAAAFLVAFCASAAQAADMTPFYRMADPVILPATTTAQQIQIPQPPGSSSYRLVNPCSVDVRLKTVASLTTTVTPTTGTRFLARTAEVMASSTAPTTPRIVSVLAMSDPGSAGCSVELTYGSGQ